MRPLNDALRHFSWITFLVIVVAIIVVVVGGIEVVKGDMTYEDWVNDLIKFAAAAGLTAIGRGIHFGLKKT